MRMSSIKIIGILLLVVGLVVVIFGAYYLIAFNNSAGGKLANWGAGLFGARPDKVNNYILQICIGIVCCVVGFVLYRKR